MQGRSNKSLANLASINNRSKVVTIIIKSILRDFSILILLYYYVISIIQLEKLFIISHLHQVKAISLAFFLIHLKLQLSKALLKDLISSSIMMISKGRFSASFTKPLIHTLESPSTTIFFVCISWASCCCNTSMLMAKLL